MSRTYLAHHELESVDITITIIIMIIIIYIIIMIKFLVEFCFHYE